MLYFIQNRKMNKAGEIEGGSGPETPENKEKVEQEGSGLDDNGYEIPKPEGEGKEEVKEPEGKSATGYDDKDKPKEEEIKEPATGYDADKAPEAPKEKEPEIESKDKSKDDAKEIEFTVEGLEAEDISEIKDFVKKHGVTKEVAQALSDQRAEEIKNQKASLVNQDAEIERSEKAQKLAWHNELKDDPDFGGENFGYNIKQAERVVDEFLPGLKKKLTEGGGMLPPYIMKDLSKMAAHLYSTKQLEQGDPPGKSNEDKAKEDDPLAFYNS